jgi:uncharacterized protein YecT (DUF1311 family)
MKKLFLIFVALIFLAGCTSNAQTKMHPIDRAEEACIDKTADTQVMNKCSDIAQRAWENEIAKTLSELKSAMDKESYKSLMNSQKSWEKYRDNEFQAINLMLLNKQGTMYLNVSKGLKVDVVRQRSLKLKEYLNTIND